MQEWVERIFSPIPNRELCRPCNEPDYSIPGICKVSKLVRIVPVGDMSWVMFTFPLLPQRLNYKTDPVTFISYLMSHKGDQGPCAHLKAHNWAHEIYVGQVESDFNCLLTIQVRVTEEGRKHWREIGDIVFSFARMLRDLDQSAKRAAFDEVTKIESLHWNTLEAVAPYQYCTAVSLKMAKYPNATEWLEAQNVIDHFDLDIIDQAFQAVRPDNCFVQIIHRGFDNGTWSPSHLEN